MSDWILPEVKKEIEAINKQRTLKEQEITQEQFLKENLQPNYVLIDAALWKEDIEIIFDKVSYRSLFRGSVGEELWSVAPYLVDITSNDGLAERIKEKDPIERRVTWLSSSANIDDLRKHLRRFLRMKQENGSFIYFRFYDPFVLNYILPNLVQDQLTVFFVNIDYIITEDIRIGERRISYLSDENELQTKYEAVDYVDNK
ncbi:DUF4123 domain-containing protein [Dysgonomonas sp. ZJ279]|uniref:DUF4123 domain-containing protein n=1 Tax=Dysgonomonas sp. ZJ279 TaxID=2709796 RepID=UPI0013ED3A48|nr:DUF4123 domain-containing protein [Dysgonomonas sp. ZJ279]